MFPQLRIIDLSYNAFSGNLPTSLFQHLKAMRTIDQSLKAPRSSYIESYYQDSITIATKGMDREIVRILYLYTALDLSNNKFRGKIPSIIGDLVALHVLSLSHNGLQGKIPQQLASLTSLAFLNLSYNHLQGCIPQGPQFHTFENNSYEGNDGLRGFPISKGCGNDQVSETNYIESALDHDQESNSEFLNDFWKGALMGYGSGLCIGLPIIYIMISTGNLKWLARIIEEMEQRIITRRRKNQRGQRHYKRRNNRF
ncbi:hypothetical protein KY290_009583 [Solanum tuberosum]|uniref:Uncharacterized protein n=1 Tax=Solanum tuberosum TaxID=4113 RepID=A0ABQ7VV89_SOLTU|nr:hypothetical protein KY289_009973 [Solanum tuberosum]KAH0772446.1 hypothetical protein KY290_009583 [Solanum tuberosum]